MTNDERDDKINDIHTAVMVMADKVNSHDNTLYGNGRDGVVTRVIKLEGVAKVLIWLAIALSLPVIGLVVKTVYEHLKS